MWLGAGGTQRILAGWKATAKKCGAVSDERSRRMLVSSPGLGDVTSFGDPQNSVMAVVTGG